MGVLLPELRRGKKKLSESDTEKESNVDDDESKSSVDAETQAEADKLMVQKGVSVIGGKLMIPADKLKIPDELCRVKTSGKAHRKTFICQICDKTFNRRDKIK